MGQRTKLPPADPILVAELRQIEQDWRARGEAERAEFRDQWAAKMAALENNPPRPIHVSAFRPTSS